MMPKIDLILHAKLSEVVIGEVVIELTELTRTLLNKRAEVTQVRVQQGLGLYFVNAVQVTDLPAFDLTISVTKGTNTEQQKAQWLQATYQLFSEVLGERVSQGINYISILELDAENWGYNGLSQYARNG